MEGTKDPRSFTPMTGSSPTFLMERWHGEQ